MVKKMQKIYGKQYYKSREFSDLREMFQQSLALYKQEPAFRFRKSPQDSIESRTYQEFHREVLMLGTAML